MNTPAITESQRMARESFNLDAAMAALPRNGPSPTFISPKGAAGVRLRACYVADISDALLREFARETLGATRCSEQYLDALRIVLGNQAEAEKYGYVLEMNQRVDFAPQRVMRTIIDQMQAAGVSFGSVVGLGSGRSQVVQCFPGKSGGHMSAADELEYRDRRQEAADDVRREAAISRGEFPRSKVADVDPYQFITDADVPY